LTNIYMGNRKWFNWVKKRC